MGRSKQPTRFISVDLPEPEAPMMATKRTLLDAQSNTLQGMDRHFAQLVGLGEVSDINERGHGAFLHPRSIGTAHWLKWRVAPSPIVALTTTWSPGCSCDRR